MKIAVTAQSAGLGAAMDPRFGRAKCFVVLDDDSNEVETIDNTQNLNAMQGAGVQSARTIAESGAEVLLTGNVGPKAFAALSAAGVRICLSEAATVREAIDAFKAGKLEETTDANVQGHWT
jgi:predicted Fe-Mo cluster-binding NifX family protein